MTDYQWKTICRFMWAVIWLLTKDENRIIGMMARITNIRNEILDHTKMSEIDGD